MRKIYKYLIVAAALLVLLLCSVFSVGAATSKYYKYIDDFSQINFVRWSVWDLEAGFRTTTDKAAFSGKALNEWEFAVYAAIPSKDKYHDIMAFSFNITPSSEFITRIDPGKNYTFIIYAGQDGTYSQPVISEFKTLQVKFEDSNGNLAVSEIQDCPTVTEDNKQWSWCTVPATQIAKISDVHRIWIEYTFDQPYDYTKPEAQTVGCILGSQALVTIEDPSTEEILGAIDQMKNDITGSIEESTDKITNGWDPDPVKPEGSESVDEMEDLEDQIMDGSQAGIDSGNEVLDGFDGALANFRGGFLFLIGIFNLLFENTWLTYVLQVSLALGLIGFILNLVPSIGAKLSRDERRAERRQKGG